MFAKILAATNPVIRMDLIMATQERSTTKKQGKLALPPQTISSASLKRLLNNYPRGQQVRVILRKVRQLEPVLVVLFGS